VEQLRAARLFVDGSDDRAAARPPVSSSQACFPAVHATLRAQAAHDRRDLSARDQGSTARRSVRFEGYTIVLIAHAATRRSRARWAEAPEHIVLVETEDDVDGAHRRRPDKIAYISQTTLSVDETRAIINRLRESSRDHRYAHDDICYATTNRQAAVKQMAGTAICCW